MADAEFSGPLAARGPFPASRKPEERISADRARFVGAAPRSRRPHLCPGLREIPHGRFIRRHRGFFAPSLDLRFSGVASYPQVDLKDLASGSSEGGKLRFPFFCEPRESFSKSSSVRDWGHLVSYFSSQIRRTQAANVSPSWRGVSRTISAKGCASSGRCVSTSLRAPALLAIGEHFPLRTRPDAVWHRTAAESSGPAVDRNRQGEGRCFVVCSGWAPD